ncbi:MAG: DUF2085 domain-containing protein [Bacilli bacterium]|nr:DUF2085 domain-containing protein [Bacilli bacterium]
MIEFIKRNLSLISERFGEAPLCNGRAETTFEVFGFHFILCYRCSFIIIGLLITVFLFNKIKLFKRIPAKYLIPLFILFIASTVLDGTLQYFFGIESTNLRRIVTGFLAGVGFGIFVELVFRPKTEDLSKLKKLENF